MSILLRICPGDAWACFIANVLVQVTVIILTARLLARLGSRWNAAWRHSVYLVALVCVLASPALSWMTPKASIALFTLPTAAHGTTSAAPLRLPISQVSQSSVADTPLAPQVAISRADRKPESIGQESRPAAQPAASFADIPRALGAAAMMIWLLGMAFFLARWRHALRLIAALRRSAKPLDCATMTELLRQVRQALASDKTPPLAASAGLDRPIMVGLIHPLVILPQSLLTTLSQAELADILVHECAHAVCRHQVVGLLQRVAGILFWPHPLVHLLNRELARAREEVCDNYVLRHSHAPRYARTLLELSQTLLGASPKPTALGLFHCHWRLEDRVADLLDRRRKVMIRINRWTVASLTVAFLLLALLVAGTNILQAAPSPPEQSPPGADDKSQPASPAAVEKIERRAINKQVKDFPEKIDLSTPESVAAVFQRNVARMDMTANIDLTWEKVDPETAKSQEQLMKNNPALPKNYGQRILDTEIIEVLSCHDDLALVIYETSLLAPGRKVYGRGPVGRINGTWKVLNSQIFGGGSSPSVQAAEESVESNKDDLWRKFVELKADVLSGHPPVQKPPPMLSAAEMADIKRRQGKTWHMNIDLDMPGLAPQAVQYSIFDKDPVPDFIAGVKRTQKAHREQLEKAENEARKEQLNDIQMEVSWDFGFKDVTGDRLWLLASDPDHPAGPHTMSSSSPAGKKWIVTKTVHIKGKPVCWCVPIEVKAGEQIDVVLNESNTFDLRKAYNDAMQEPGGIGDMGQMKKLVDDYIRHNLPEITSRETIEWGDIAKAENGNASIRYKYFAKFENKDTKIMNQIFTFDANGKFVSVKNVDGFPRDW